MVRHRKHWLWWAPRLLAAAFLGFLALFSLDVIAPEATAGEIALGLLLHNIPVLVLLGMLVVAWRLDAVGAAAFAAAGSFYVIMVVGRAGVPWYTALSWSAIIAGPAFVIAGLFWLNWQRNRPRRR